MVKKIALGLLLIIVLFVLFIFVKFEIDKNKKYSTFNFEISKEVEQADVQLGKRIYHVRAGCVDCHGKDLSGIKIMENGAMGTIYGSNISPYNLKSWSDKEIATAIRYGVHKSGRSLRFMPSFDFQGLSKGDVASVIKYLRSQPEVAKQSPSSSFGPIVKLLSAMNKIPVMFPAKTMDLTKGFEEKPPETVSVEFGKYLANSCIGCHGTDYKGGPIAGGDPKWPEASNIRLGSNHLWTKDVFAKMIKTGISPISNKQLRIPMPIWLLKEFDDKEIESLWLYLSSLK